MEYDERLRDTGKIEEWQANSVRETLLRQGHKRFGEPSAEMIQALDAISSVEELQQMAVRLLEVESWEELLTSA